MIPLEDNFNDIIAKAQRGLKLEDSCLAEKAGVSPAQLQQVKEGQVDESVIRKVAPVLGLGAQALVDLANKSWYPRDPGKVVGLAAFNTVYFDMTVNAYLVWDPTTSQAVVFDTGSDAKPIIEFVRKEFLNVTHILLTHTHGDHIADLEKLKLETAAKVYVGENEAIDGAEPFAEGKEFTVGSLLIQTRQTSGHSKGGITYIISGLNQPIAIVGDAIFAGSMGGGMISYQDALRNNREKIMSLEDHTILCPGHGPLTTVGEEKKHNPFFPEFQQ